MAQKISALKYLTQRGYSSKDRVLLINPPVIEVRYQWLQWNQPLDLLKLSTLLKREFGCEIQLFDFMLPRSGKVPKLTPIPRDGAEIRVGDYIYPVWHYGRSFQEFDNFINNLKKSWNPTEIWITSLTSYWWKGVYRTILKIKNKLQDIPIMLYGNYPRLETEHANEKCYADVLLTDALDLRKYQADLKLYSQNEKPDFCAIDVNDNDILEEISKKIEMGIHKFVFFNEDILSESADRLGMILSDVIKYSTQLVPSARPKFYGICGLLPGLFTTSIAKIMRDSGFVELHFEYEIQDDRELNLDSYLRAKEAHEKSGFRLRSSDLSGFVNIGLPTDDIERIIRHCFNIIELFGFVIPKPFTPTPGSHIYQEYKKQIDKVYEKGLEFLSPHLFPFSTINRISHQEYDELYRLTAFLNYQIKQKSFDLFPGTFGYTALKSSIDKEVWKLGRENGEQIR